MGATGEVRIAPQVQFGETAAGSKTAVDANPRTTHPSSPRLQTKSVLKTALPVAKDAALSQVSEHSAHAASFAATNGHLPPKKEETGTTLTQIPRSPEEREKHFKGLIEKAQSDDEIVKLASGMVKSPIHCVLFLKAAAKGNPAKIIEYAQKLYSTEPDFARSLLKAEGMKEDSAERVLVEPQIKAKITDIVNGSNKEKSAKELVQIPRFMEYLNDNPIDAAKVFCTLRDNKIPLKEASKIEECITKSLHDIESKVEIASKGLTDLQSMIQKLSAAGPAKMKERLTVEAKYVELNKQLSDLEKLRKNVITAKVGEGDGGMMSLDKIEELANYKPKYDKKTFDTFLKAGENADPIFKNYRYTKIITDAQKNVKSIRALESNLTADKEVVFRSNLTEVMSAVRNLSSEQSRKVDSQILAYHENSATELEQIGSSYRDYVISSNTTGLDELMSMKEKIEKGESQDLKQLRTQYDKTKVKLEQKYQEMAKLNLNPAAIKELKAKTDAQLAAVEAMLPSTT